MTDWQERYELVRHCVSALNWSEYSAFVYHVLAGEYGADNVVKAGDKYPGVFIRTAPGTQAAAAYLIDTYPYELTTSFDSIRSLPRLQVLLPEVARTFNDKIPTLRRFFGDPLEPGRDSLTAFCFLNNVSGLDSESFSSLEPRYRALMDALPIEWEQFQVGNPSTYGDADNVAALRKVMADTQDGLCILIKEEGLSVGGYHSGKHLIAGVTRTSLSPISPFYIRQLRDQSGESAEIARQVSCRGDIRPLLELAGRILGDRAGVVMAPHILLEAEVDAASRDTKTYLKDCSGDEWGFSGIFEFGGKYLRRVAYGELLQTAHSESAAWLKRLREAVRERSFLSEGVGRVKPAIAVLLEEDICTEMDYWKEIRVEIGKDLRLLTEETLTAEIAARNQVHPLADREIGIPDPRPESET